MTAAKWIRGLALVAAISPATVALAQDDAPARVAIELNAAQQMDQGCKLSFLVTNTHAADIDKAVYETVIFDANGQVSRLTLFDFGSLPSSRPRVRQFVIPGTACDAIGQVLFNGAQTCDGATAGACAKDLTLSTRTGIEVTG